MGNQAFLKFEDERVRLDILRLLKEDPDYTMNDDILKKMLELVGFNLDSVRLAANTHWLARAGMITMQEVSIYHVITLTQQGNDVASGRMTFPGIARPDPE